MTHAAAKHRALDVELAERLARDGKCRRSGTFGVGPAGALLPSRQRMMDLRTMSRPRVLLATLSLRTSAKGREYLSGWLGKASVVGFRGEPDRFENDTYNLYVSEPEPREGVGVRGSDTHRQRQERESVPAAVGGVDADWDSL